MKKQGLTLIELLIVLGILAVIAAILFPVFASVREKGRRTVCQSNLRQMGLAMQQYVQENDSRYLPPQIVPLQPYSLQSYVGNNRIFLCPDLTQMQQEQMGQIGGISIGYQYDWYRLLTRSLPTKPWEAVSDSQVAHPAALWLYQDNTDFLWHKLPAPCGHPVIGSTLHSGGGNYLFADGHIQWLTPEQFGGITCTNGPLSSGWQVE